MGILNLCLMVAIASLGSRRDVDAKGVPDANLVARRVERSNPYARTPLLHPTCQNIKNSVSSASAVYAPGTPEFLKDIGAWPLTPDGITAHVPKPTEHWASSSTEYAACSVEPGSVQDVSAVVRVPLPFCVLLNVRRLWHFLDENS